MCFIIVDYMRCNHADLFATKFLGPFVILGGAANFCYWLVWPLEYMKSQVQAGFYGNRSVWSQMRLVIRDPKHLDQQEQHGGDVVSSEEGVPVGTETVVRYQDLIAVVSDYYCVNFINSLFIVSNVHSMLTYLCTNVLGVLIVLLQFIFISFCFYWDRSKYICDIQYL